MSLTNSVSGVWRGLQKSVQVVWHNYTRVRKPRCHGELWAKPWETRVDQVNAPGRDPRRKGQRERSERKGDEEEAGPGGQAGDGQQSSQGFWI